MYTTKIFRSTCVNFVALLNLFHCALSVRDAHTRLLTRLGCLSINVQWRLLTRLFSVAFRRIFIVTNVQFRRNTSVTNQHCTCWSRFYSAVCAVVTSTTAATIVSVNAKDDGCVVDATRTPTEWSNLPSSYQL